MLAVLIASLSSVAIPAIVVVAPPAVGSRLSDEALDHIRGGFLLPNGLAVTLGIDIQTRVDGVLVLHTVYASEGPTAGIHVYTDGLKQVGIAPTSASGSAGQIVGTPLVVVDRSPTGTTIVPTSSTPATTVNLVSSHGDLTDWQPSEGQTEIPVSRDGSSVSATPGRVSFMTDATGAVVSLKAPDFEVKQLIGQATGVVIANTGNDRVIETVSSVNVDLRGLAAARLGSVFATQRAVLEGLVTR